MHADVSAEANIVPEDGDTVMNVEGTSCHDNPDGWLNLWKENVKGVKKESPSCAAYSCGNTALVGAHVYRNQLTQQNCYIIPLCRGCNAPNSTSVLTRETEDKWNGTNIIKNTRFVKIMKDECYHD